MKTKNLVIVVIITLALWIKICMIVLETAEARNSRSSYFKNYVDNIVNNETKSLSILSKVYVQKQIIKKTVDSTNDFTEKWCSIESSISSISTNSNDKKSKYKNAIQAGKDYVITTYLQKGAISLQFEAEDISYIKEYYLSIKRLNLNAIILHDNLSQDFIDMYSTERITFIKSEDYSEYMPNDRRFMLFRDLLCANYYYSASSTNEDGLLLMTDGSDVLFKKNPFTLMHEYPNLLFAGLDRQDSFDFYNYMQETFNRCKYDLDFFIASCINTHSLALNAGIIGGNKEQLLRFLNEMIYWLTKKHSSGSSNSSTKLNCNMAAFTCVFTDNVSLPFYAGPPWQSKFGEYEYNSTFAYIIHK